MGWGWHINTATHVLRLILGGVFDRYPSLQIIIGHRGEATYANLVAQVGIGRVCFSADYPFGSMLTARAFLENLPLSRDDRASISHRNAEKLLSL